MEQRFHLPVSGGHQLHIACYGNPAARPILFLHGGPGSGCNAGQRGLFDPEAHYAIFMDQRGAGQSLPQRCREANSTQDLIHDIEALREYLGLQDWLVTGGSWGATLALAYAQAHPDRVRALALRAVFLGTRAELDGAFQTRLATFFPKLYRDFLHHLPADQRDDPLPAYWARILHPAPAVHGPAAWIWHDVERAMSELPAPYDDLPHRDPQGALPSTPFMEAHYFSQDCFLAPDQLMRDVHKIAHIPAIIVQGRHDLLCPPSTSAALAAQWPAAQVKLVETAGHALSHPPVFEALKAAIRALA